LSRQGYGYGYGPAARTNRLAIASFWCSIGGLILFAIPSVLGVIFGFVSHWQINRSNGMQKGSGLAVAGIVIGFSTFVLWIVLAIAIAHPLCSAPHGRC
jgi:hypothetical protein